MKKTVLIWAILATCVLGACASPYKSQSNFWYPGFGYDDVALNRDTYIVSFRGNSIRDTESDMTKKLLYRAAEIAKDNGAQYFVIQNGGSSSTQQQGFIPGYSNTSTNGVVMVNPYTGIGSYSGQSTSSIVPARVVTSNNITLKIQIHLVRDISRWQDKERLLDANLIMMNNKFEE